MTGTWAWVSLAALGVYHGINPAMGWLFAVARGLHQQRTRAVVASLAPIALGHALSVAAVLTMLSISTLVIPPDPLRWAAAVILIGFGIYKLARPRSHPTWVGFRIGAPALMLWSLLMSTAHGAGLMLVPFLLPTTAGAAHHDMAHHTTGLTLDSTATNLLALLLHTTTMLLAMAIIAVIVYRHVGLAILRKAWLNFDALWAGVLILSGAFLLI